MSQKDTGVKLKGYLLIKLRTISERRMNSISNESLHLKMLHELIMIFIRNRSEEGIIELENYDLATTDLMINVVRNHQ